MGPNDDHGSLPVHSDQLASKLDRQPPVQYSLRSLLLVVGAIAFGLAMGIQISILVAVVVACTYCIVKRRAGYCCAIVGMFLVLSILGMGNSVEVRLDTGEQRVLFWGIPISYRMLKLDDGTPITLPADPAIPKRWVWCATQVGSNNADSMVYTFYRRASAWVDVDPEIAKLLIRDIAQYVETMHARQGLPDGVYLLSFINLNDRELKKDWDKDPEVQDYLTRKGYKKPVVRTP